MTIKRTPKHLREFCFIRHPEGDLSKPAIFTTVFATSPQEAKAKYQGLLQFDLSSQAGSERAA